jgi:mRNA (guanine-N7-)-methyltransferase
MEKKQGRNEKTEEKETSSPKSIKQKTQEFENIVKEYLESNPVIRSHNKNNELEIRFGTNTRNSRPISKIDYDNVVKQLYSCGFKTQNPDGMQILRIIPESVDSRTGKTKMSIRGELVGTDLIQEYCRTNSIQAVINMPSTLFNKVKFTRKMTAMNKSGGFINRLDMDDFNFRVSFQTEQDYNVQSEISRNIISRWADSKKLFRSMNRVRFYHDELPIFADLSIVKSSAKSENKVPLPQYTIQEGGVFNNIEQYEIELEVDNASVGKGTDYDTVSKLLTALRKSIRIVLSGLQGTKFPISYTEQEKIIQEYMKVVHGDEHIPRRVNPGDFIGPSSFTLQLDNIVPISETSLVPNIRNNFTVTDKADGDRKLLYVSEDGKIYMIDTNMTIIFTGTKTAEKTIHNSIIDGEHIKYNKKGEYINLYAAFDVYYVNKKSVREFPFLREDIDDDEHKFRLYILKQFIDLLKPISILEVVEKEVVSKENKKSADFIVKCKTFKATSETATIFEGCSSILSDIKDGTYEYNTDGLIFTPSDLAVGGTIPGGPAGKLSKITWSQSFKWKPAEFNTIDFLVSIKKDKTGKDEIHHIFQDGHNMFGIQDVTQYKTLVLHVGFDPRTDGYVNPFQDLLNDVLPTKPDTDNESKYKPVPFVPTDPYDPNACFCNIILEEDGTKLFMKTEEGEYFEDDMIVEFKYVDSNKDGWKWVPLRVRYDKTAQLRSRKNNFGNAYKVANNNWYSIHHPITEDMICTGDNIPERTMDEEVYYNRSNEETSTQALRDFHNLYVKKNLILGVSHVGDTLIDIAVGKAGDLKKWVVAKLSFVFGIDISKDNIHNQIDGACARYLNEARKNGHIPKALFVNGDSGLNIRSGQAFATEKDKQVAKAIFGQGAKDVTILGKGVYNQYGVAESGFNITSCQFAMHYFFKNKDTFHQLLRNIAECTKINGYFIGTCYDGRTVFNLLKSVKNEEGVTIMKEGRKIYEIIKMYDQTGFPDEEMSLGYAINVFQESINQYFREYLVNFDYFTRIMEDYGFVLLSKDEAKYKNLPNGTGMFSELFNLMEIELKGNPNNRANYRKAQYMTPEEKRISFMNRYFIFKKIRDVDVKKMAHVISKELEFDEKHSEEDKKELVKIIEERDKKVDVEEKKVDAEEKKVDAEEKKVEEEPIKKKKRLVLKKQPEIPAVSISKEKMFITIKK